MALRRIHRVAGTVAALCLAVPATAAAHVTRYTTATATATSGDCSVAFPCRIDYAIEGASAGDEVDVAPGEYHVDARINAPQVDIVGEAGARPVIVGADTLGSEILSFQSGGSLRHLALRGTAAGQDALVLEDGTAEDLDVAASAGNGVRIFGAPGTTLLRDSVVRADAATAISAGRPGGGDIALRNVTAIAPAATAIACEVSGGGLASFVNVIARGGVADIDATTGGAACSASYSNLRPALSTGLTLDAGIQSADPLFEDAAAGDFHPLAGSPTIDAGTADALNGTKDPDGTPRGATPDIGAYECCRQVVTPTPTGGDNAKPDEKPTPADKHDEKDTSQKHEPVPALGTSIVVAPGQGRVLVRRPGNDHFTALDVTAELPVGTVVDARFGRIKLTTALDSSGNAQTGTFWGGRFKVLQNAGEHGMTSLALRGGNFARCPRRASASSLARASGVAREYPRRKVVRSLWARDRGGRFRTYGNNSVATARGTAWVTRDRCDGTVTRVTEGAVAVRDTRRGRTVLVRAGHRYLARR